MTEKTIKFDEKFKKIRPNEIKIIPLFPQTNDMAECKQRIADKILERKILGKGAASMIELSNNIDTDKMPRPSFMAVIVGVGKFAYQRKDGVYVIPIGCLKD